MDDSNNHKKVFTELSEIIAKMFALFVAIIAFKNTDAGEELFKTHTCVTGLMVLMILLYFLLWILVTVLQHSVKNFFPNLIMLGFGSVVSTLASRLVSSTLTWITLTLWVFIFITMVSYNYEKLCELIPNEVLEKKNMLMERLQTAFGIPESSKPPSIRSPV